MDALIVKPKIRSSFTNEPVFWLTRSVVRAASTEYPSWFLQSNSTIGPEEDIAGIEKIQDIHSAFTETPYWLPQNNATISAYEDKFAVFEHTVYALCKAKRDRDAIAESLNYFDQRLIARQFRECDRALRQLQVAKLASSVIVSILGITIRAKKLKSRTLFFKRAFQEIAQRKGRKYARELLAKYR